MVYFPLDNCAVVGFIRPPASTQKWLYPAPPVKFGLTVIWLFFHHGVSNWLILESRRVPGQSGRLFLCQISCFFCVPSQESSAQGQKPGRSHPGLYVQYLSVCSHERGVSVGVPVAMRMNQGAHGCNYRFRVSLSFTGQNAIEIHRERKFLFSLCTSLLWLTGKLNVKQMLLSQFFTLSLLVLSLSLLLHLLFLLPLTSFPLILLPIF